MTTDDDRAELERLQISTQADLHRMWELLMQPLGWRARSLWVTLIGCDRRPTRMLLEVAECPAVPTEARVAGLYDVLGQIMRQDGAAASAAFLVARPGRDPLSDDDRLFARRLHAGAARAGVDVEIVHVATDIAIWAVAPDDLAA